MTARVSTLDNGLRVVTNTMDTVESASVGVWVGTGTRHESDEINGVSHLLEHMAFKGTRRRSALDIATEIEDVGGHLNAYTSRENTAYYAKVLKEDVGLALDIIADILQNAVMDDTELARERAVIVQEILQARDTPDDVIFDHFQESAFPDQPLGRPVMGSAERVESMSRETVLDYMKAHYTADRMVLAAAGRIDHDALIAQAAEVFGDLPAADRAECERARYVGGDHREHRDLEQVHLLFGLKGMAYEDPDFYAVSVLSNLLGGGMSSRLFQEVREKRGLAYNIYSFLSCYADSGLFGIYAATGETEVGKLLPLITDELMKVCDGVDADEVARGRTQLKANVLMSLESTSSRCEQLARQMIVFGRPLPTREVVEKIEAVDEEAIKRAAKRLVAGSPTVATLGLVSKVESYERVAARLA